jgi:hypothetical protein
MTYIVAKPFATSSRRFSEGDRVRASDVTGPVPVARWVALGFLTPPPSAKKPPPVKPAQPPPPD